MTTEDAQKVPAPLGPVERVVRPPTKADIDRLGWLLRDWAQEEKNLRNHYGNEVTPGSMRARRLKDADALGRALQYLMALRSPERPNQTAKRRRSRPLERTVRPGGRCPGPAEPPQGEPTGWPLTTEACEAGRIGAICNH